MESTTHATERHARVDEVITTNDDVEHADGVLQAARIVAMVAGGIVAVIGLIALMRIDWQSATVDAPLVDVFGMAFTPVTAVVTAVLGLFLIGAGAMREGDGRLALGGVLAALGLAILLVGELETSWQVGDRHGWLALSVGAVFVVAGVLADGRYAVRRQRAVRREVDSGVG